MTEFRVSLNAESTVVPMLDWNNVWPGKIVYPADSNRCQLEDIPTGIFLRVQPARLSESFLERRHPWEYHLNYLQVIKEDGVFRLWHRSMPPEDLVRKYGNGASLELCCYAESDNGFDWKRPNLGMRTFDGSANNNIVGITGYSLDDDWLLNQVFIDSGAASSERYKSNGECRAFTLNGEALPRSTRRGDLIRMQSELVRLNHSTSPTPTVLSVRSQMFGYSSSDGIRWKKNDVPILEVEGYLDSQNQLTYDPGRSKYVAYMRGEVNLRRSVREASSREFSRDWSTPKNMLVADSQDPPDVDIYSVGFHYEPESKWRYMFMSMFHRAQDTVNIQLAVSRDGELWSRPERLPIVPTEIDQFYGQNYGQMYCSPGLIEFDEDHWALAVVAKTKTHHDYVFKDNQLLPVVAAGEYRWAIWRRHRLAALEAPLEGSFMLHSLTCISSRLVVNFSAERGGFLAAELVDFSDMPWKALEGFSFEDCDFAYGDQSSHVMSWRGHSDLTKLRGMNLAIRFRMLKAKLFSISV